MLSIASQNDIFFKLKENFKFFKLIFRERKGEKHQSLVPLIYAFIGCFLYV